MMSSPAMWSNGATAAATSFASSTLVYRNPSSFPTIRNWQIPNKFGRVRTGWGRRHPIPPCINVRSNSCPTMVLVVAIVAKTAMALRVLRQKPVIGRNDPPPIFVEHQCMRVPGYTSCRITVPGTTFGRCCMSFAIWRREACRGCRTPPTRTGRRAKS